MRRKLLMFTVAVAAGASINLVYADDLTSRLVNPSFEDGVTGWTVDNPNECTSETRTAGVATDNDFGAVETVPDGTNFYYARKGWATTTSSINQTVTGLSAGSYKLSLSSLGLHVNATSDVANYTISVKNAQGTVLASKTITASDVASGTSATDGPINAMAWTATELAFNLDALSDITVEVDFNYVPNGTSFLLDDFKLNYVPNPTGNIFLSNEKTYKAIGSNLIENADFENGLTGWFAGNHSALDNSIFSVLPTGGQSGAYLTGGNADGATGAGSLELINTSLNPSKTYVFSYYTKALSAEDVSAALTSFTVNTADVLLSASGKKIVSDPFSTVQLASANVGVDWTQNYVVFTGASGLSAKFFDLNAKYAFDSFELAEVAEVINTDALQEVIATAEALYTNAVDGAEKDNLNAAIIAAKSHLEATSDEEVTAAVTALNEAIGIFKYGGASVENPMDLTSLVTNADFEASPTTTGWAYTGTVQNFARLAAGTRTGFAGSALETWSPGGSAISRKVYQVLTGLPAGVYSIEAAIFANDQSSTGNLNGVFLFGNDATAKITVGQGSDASAIYTVNNVLVTNGTLELGYKLVDAYANWSAIDNVKLYYLGSEAMTTAMAATLTATIATAEALQGSMLATVAGDLSTALAAAKTALAAEPQLYNTMKEADDALKLAITAAEVSIAVYAPLGTLITEAKSAGLESATGYADLAAAITVAEGVYNGGTATSEDITTAVTDLAAALKACRYTAPLPADYTFLVANPSFENGVTSWTGLTATHGYNSALSGFTGNFAESWSGSTLADKDIYQTLSDLPNGEYVITMYANAVKQGALTTEITGANFYANDQKIAINSANSDGKDGNVQFYSLGVKVTDGTLKIGVKLESTNCNWLSFDNVALTYYGETVEAADIDATDFIVNPSITTTTGNVKVAPTGWTESTNSGGNGAFTKASSGNTFLEAWGGTASALNFNYKQRIANLPAGTYTLNAATFAASTSGKAVLYAKVGETELQTPMTTGIDGNTASWQTVGATTVANITIAKDDTLTIGVKNIATLDGAWHGADNFSLTYTSGYASYLQGQITAASKIGQMEGSVATKLALAMGSAERSLASTSTPVLLQAIASMSTVITAANTSAAEYAKLADALVAA
ncbi:MAG: hypothetical protein WCQ86_02730, partial [Bacteroidaceae bacterium]